MIPRRPSDASVKDNLVSTGRCKDFLSMLPIASLPLSVQSVRRWRGLPDAGPVPDTPKCVNPDRVSESLSLGL